MKIKVFSEDAIQRIASGNEPSQTLISMDVLKKVLNPFEMRNVLGGSGQDDDDDFDPTACRGGDFCCTCTHGVGKYECYGSFAVCYASLEQWCERGWGECEPM